PAKAERSHVRPHFPDIGEAFLLRPALAHSSPSPRKGCVDAPNRILLFVVHHNLTQPSIVFHGANTWAIIPGSHPTPNATTVPVCGCPPIDPISFFFRKILPVDTENRDRNETSRVICCRQSWHDV